MSKAIKKTLNKIISQLKNMAKSFTKKLYNQNDVLGWLKQAEDDVSWQAKR